MKQKREKISTTTRNRLNSYRNLTVKDLMEVKMELKASAEMQQEILQTSSKEIIPFKSNSTVLGLLKGGSLPLKMVSYAFKNRGIFSILESVIIGIRLVNKLKRVVKKK